MYFLYSSGVVTFNKCCIVLSTLIFYSPNFQGLILMKNALNNQVGMHVFMACNKLEAMVIYLVKQACGNDKLACVQDVGTCIDMYNCIHTINCIASHYSLCRCWHQKIFSSHRCFFVHANDNPIRSSRNEKVFEIHRFDTLKRTIHVIHQSHAMFPAKQIKGTFFQSYPFIRILYLLGIPFV